MGTGAKVISSQFSLKTQLLSSSWGCRCGGGCSPMCALSFTCIAFAILQRRLILQHSWCICAKLRNILVANVLIQPSRPAESRSERMEPWKLVPGGWVTAPLSQFPRQLHERQWLHRLRLRLTHRWNFPKKRKINGSGSQKSGSCMFMVSQVKRRAGQEAHVWGCMR